METEEEKKSTDGTGKRRRFARGTLPKINVITDIIPFSQGEKDGALTIYRARKSAQGNGERVKLLGNNDIQFHYMHYSFL